MTTLEVRALLARVNARLLREDAGIRRVTVARALGVPYCHVFNWETGRHLPVTPEGRAWIRFIAGLERHAAVTAELRDGERAAS